MTRELLARAGGKEGYRRSVQSYVTRGVDPDEFTAFSERAAIGSREFLECARKGVKLISPEHSDRSFVVSRIPFDKVVSVVESVKEEPFSEFRDRHGDWGLAMVFHLARQHSGLTLQQVGEMAGGMAYKTAFARIKYLRKKMKMDSSLQRAYDQCNSQLSILEK